jgi:mono/diheme cytochrome c family protein
MKIYLNLAWALCLFLTGAALSHAEQKPGEGSRGELLYSTYCIGCHASNIHWRDKKLAKDWHSLKQQVRRWQSFSGLGWSDEQITDVTRYLNDAYYHFSAGADETSHR